MSVYFCRNVFIAANRDPKNDQLVFFLSYQLHWNVAVSGFIVSMTPLISLKFCLIFTALKIIGISESQEIAKMLMETLGFQSLWLSPPKLFGQSKTVYFLSYFGGSCDSTNVARLSHTRSFLCISCRD